MAKVLVYDVDSKERNLIIKELFLILSDLNSFDDVFAFLSGFVTPSEALMLGRRIRIAQMLIAGETHDEIKKKMKVGYQTITRIEHWLKSDENKHLLIKRKIGKETQKNKSRKSTRSYSMLDKYAMHRFWN
ncbi:MAG TPA: hypothetical protein DEA43_04870 [Candidatus Moranbacteria bacterium]|nr:Trp family transcriptional regulator [Candidatus Moranbacteria bacterium]HBI34240.1 hypothetical protein [Candidatus Moranbacteria bacterium]HBT46185.1 hypothetical protein [Candidatus Moranbacteria bacterium]